MTRSARRAEEWRVFRARHRLTQQALAEILGVSRWTVKNVEQERFTPGKKLLARFKILKGKHARANAGAKVEWSRDSEGSLGEDRPSPVAGLVNESRNLV
jgi:DNA-binding XRE family transcriptional regulator